MGSGAATRRVFKGQKKSLEVENFQFEADIGSVSFWPFEPDLGLFLGDVPRGTVAAFRWERLDLSTDLFHVEQIKLKACQAESGGDQGQK
jgi:hypothetical protein